MKELPGDVFVTGQLLAAQMQALAEQGVMSFINNRPDMEGPMQPLSEELEKTAQELDEYQGFAEQHLSELKAILDAEQSDYAT